MHKKKLAGFRASYKCIRLNVLLSPPPPHPPPCYMYINVSVKHITLFCHSQAFLSSSSSSFSHQQCQILVPFFSSFKICTPFFQVKRKGFYLLPSKSFISCFIPHFVGLQFYFFLRRPSLLQGYFTPLCNKLGSL